jgi:tRNA(Ile)-lysidine synthase
VKRPDPSDRFDAVVLERTLRCEFGLGAHQALLVAFSGGLDSTALLYALLQIGRIDTKRITALHFNHALHEQAGAWEAHCRASCSAWGAAFRSSTMTSGATSGRGVEAMAREARYRWLAQQMSADSVLLTAHHFDDHVETVLANLFRGSGARGLGGIRKSRSIACGRLWRPLLSVARASLEKFAVAHGLSWIEDPMNIDDAYTRNHIRHRVLPVMREKWPQVDRVIARSAQNCLDASELLDELAEADLREIRSRRNGDDYVLSVSALQSLGRRRMLNALRHWFVECGFHAPSRRRLFDMVDSLVDATPEPTCVMAWSGIEVRRYRDLLHLAKQGAREAFTGLDWDPHASAPVLVNGLVVAARDVRGDGILRSVYERQKISLRPRRGGERCRAPGNACRKKLKKIFQEKGIPPWRRDDFPLLYISGQLAGVVGVCYCQPYAADGDEAGVVFELQSDSPAVE